MLSANFWRFLCFKRHLPKWARAFIWNIFHPLVNGYWMYKFRDVTNSSAAAVTIVGSEPEPEPAANITRCKSFSSPRVYVGHFRSKLRQCEGAFTCILCDITNVIILLLRGLYPWPYYKCQLLVVRNHYRNKYGKKFCEYHPNTLNLYCTHSGMVLFLIMSLSLSQISYTVFKPQ